MHCRAKARRQQLTKADISRFPPLVVAATREFGAPPLYTKGARRPTTRALRRHGWRPKRTAKAAMREDFSGLLQGLAQAALRHHLAHVLIQRAGLRNGFDGSKDLRI